MDPGDEPGEERDVAGGADPHLLKVANGMQGKEGRGNGRS